MTAKVTLQKTTVNVLFTTGTTESGTTKTYAQSLGRISPTNFDAEKAMAIINLLTPCVLYPLNSVTKFDSSVITKEA